jgi:hypothetical protein
MVQSTVITARAARLCRFCQQGVGDEMHMLAECEAYDVVRRSHADLFFGLGLFLSAISDECDLRCVL